MRNGEQNQNRQSWQDATEESDVLERMLLVWTFGGKVLKNVLPFTEIKLYPKILVESMASGLCKPVLSLTCRTLTKEHSVLFLWSPLSLGNFFFPSFPYYLQCLIFSMYFCLYTCTDYQHFPLFMQQKFNLPIFKKKRQILKKQPRQATDSASIRWIEIFHSSTSGNCGWVTLGTLK